MEEIPLQLGKNKQDLLKFRGDDIIALNYQKIYKITMSHTSKKNNMVSSDMNFSLYVNLAKDSYSVTL